MVLGSSFKEFTLLMVFYKFGRSGSTPTLLTIYYSPPTFSVWYVGCVPRTKTTARVKPE